ncbi:G2/M phase-specific E3 ubiquitin-protein ligase-like, partial [Clarias magur]
AIVLHSTTRLIPMLQQLRKGLELYGLVNQMATNPEACHSLFVPGKIIKPDADFMMMTSNQISVKRGPLGRELRGSSLTSFKISCMSLKYQ